MTLLFMLFVAYAQASQITFAPVHKYATAKEIAKIASAEAKLNQVIQSSCFYNYMSQRKLIQTNGRTPAQVAAHLQGLTGVVPVKMYYTCMRSWRCPGGTSAVAYRQPPSQEINLNRAVFTTAMTDCAWAKTLAHESLGHSLGGYDHDYNWNKQRSFSVPYSMGGADQSQGGDAFDVCCK